MEAGIGTAQLDPGKPLPCYLTDFECYPTSSGGLKVVAVGQKLPLQLR